MPQVDLHFDASRSVINLLNFGCGAGSTARCDDSVAVSDGLPAPEVMSAYVLNDLKVEVQSNVLREYVCSYNQEEVPDPSTGQNESAAGYRTLGKIVEEEGTAGTVLNAPVTTTSYIQKTEHYSDQSKILP